MMFTIDNTPTNKSYLKKGLSKLRRSTRKHAKSPVQLAKNRGQENMPTMNIQTAAGQVGRNRKATHLANKNQKYIRSCDYKQDSKVANNNS